MTLLGKLGCAGNVSRGFPLAMRVFERYGSSKVIQSLENILNRDSLKASKSESDLNSASIFIKRNIALNVAARSLDKPKKSAKRKVAKRLQGSDWSHLDIDFKKIQKILLAEATTSPIREVSGNHGIKPYKNLQSGSRCKIQEGSSTRKSGSFENCVDADKVTFKKEKVKKQAAIRSALSTNEDFKVQSKISTIPKLDSSFAQNAFALTSAYITTSTSWQSSDKNDNSGFIPPFFHILPKLAEHERKQQQQRTVAEDFTAPSQDKQVDYARVADSSYNNFQSRDHDSKEGVHGKRKYEKPKESKENFRIRPSNKEKQVKKINPYESIPLMGVTLMPPLKNDKEPPSPKVDCQIQVSKEEKHVEIASKEDDKKPTTAGCKETGATGPKCDDGINAKKSSEKVARCSPCTTGKKHEDSKSVGNVKEGAVKGDSQKETIDCSKHSSEKVVADSGPSASGPNGGDDVKAGHAICSKYVTTTKDSKTQDACKKQDESGKATLSASQNKNTAKNDELKKIDCSKYKNISESKDPQQEKAEPNIKADKPEKNSSSALNGCGGVKLESSKASIECRAIEHEKKDNKPAEEKMLSVSASDKNTPIDCSNTNAIGGVEEDTKKFDPASANMKPPMQDSQTSAKAKSSLDCSKYVKTSSDQVKASDQLKRSEDCKPKHNANESGSAKPSSSSAPGDTSQFCSNKKETDQASKATSSSNMKVITKSKDCKPTLCSKKVETLKKSPPPPPKVDPAKRIKVQEAPKLFNCCLQITGREKVQIENCPMPVTCGDMVIVKMESLGLCASDVYMYNQGTQKVGENDISLGHEGAGVVVEVGPGCKHLKKGDAVVVEPGVPCGHCKYCRVGRYNICTNMQFRGLFSTYIAHPGRFCHKIQKTTELQKAALAHPLALALHACEKGRVSVGSKVLILGACPRGLSTVIAARSMGADKIAIIDILEKNLKVASELCADKAIMADPNLTEYQLAEKILAEMKCRPNVVIDCCGCSKTVKMAVDAVEQGGHCVLSGCQAEFVDFPILPALAKEVCYHSSFRSANMFPKAISLIETHRADVEKMITHCVEFCDAQDAFQCAAKEEESGAIKVMIKWPKPKEEGEDKKQ